MKIELLNKQEIEEQVFWISISIGEYLRSKNYNKIPIFTCILNGGFFFYADLIKNLNFELKCDFLRASSYIGTQNKEVKITKYPELSIKGEVIFLVDDILDSGNTMNFLIKEYRRREALDVIPVTLIKRESSPIIDNLICGKTIGSEWLSGYGMDNSSGTDRNRNYIYYIKNS